MEVAFLRFIATEDDLNRLLSRWLTPPSKLRDLSIEVIPDELLLRGVYETILRVPFKCFWKISVFDRRMVAELSNIKCVGVRLNLLKPYVLNESNVSLHIREPRIPKNLVNKDLLG
jgi:hypothetical protein